MGNIRTSGWPFVATVGPCSEWQETICTSSGRYRSNAARSGALTDVWPPTIAPTLVADDHLDPNDDAAERLTKPILFDHVVDVLRLDGIHDKIRRS